MSALCGLLLFIGSFLLIIKCSPLTLKTVHIINDHEHKLNSEMLQQPATCMEPFQLIAKLQQWQCLLFPYFGQWNSCQAVHARARVHTHSSRTTNTHLLRKVRLIHNEHFISVLGFLGLQVHLMVGLLHALEVGLHNLCSKYGSEKEPNS